MPQASLAAGRVVLEFVDGHVDRPVWQDVEPYLDGKRKVVRSTTGQLRWNYSGRGFFTINTPGTQGAVGYIGNRRHVLEDVSLADASPFVTIYVTARKRDHVIADADSLLITALGRALPEGTVVDRWGTSPMIRGDGRMLIEPVRATVTFRRKAVCHVFALDHDGRLPAEPLRVPVTGTPRGRQVVLDGARYRTMYYLVEFPRRRQDGAAYTRK